MHDNNPPKQAGHLVKKEDLSRVLEAWSKDVEAEKFQLYIEETETGDFFVSALPFTVKEHITDGEVWQATIVVDLDSKELTENSFVKSRFFEPVKKSPEVDGSVTLLPYPGKGQTVYRLHASSVVSGGIADKKPTARMRAAIRGFARQLKSWISVNDESLCDEAEACLLRALPSAGSK